MAGTENISGGFSDGVDVESMKTGEPIAVFFASDPQVDTLMRSRLINGFNVRVGGRVPQSEMFPYMGFILQQLFTGKMPKSCEEQADARLLEVARGSSQSQEKLLEAVEEYRREVDLFKRNRMQHPHNLFRDFEEDPSSRILVHESKNAVSFQVQSMSELETALDDWEDGTLSEKMADVFLHTPLFAILLLGSWTSDGHPSGLVMVVCQLTAHAETLLDKYLHPATETLKLSHLGPEGNIENDAAFFEDLSLLENTPSRDHKAAGQPTISKLRLWQSNPRGSSHGGSVVALQAWYGESHSLTSGRRGSRSSAQFFVDILFEHGELIREISGYCQHGEYGYLQLETSKGLVHAVGLRQAGTYFRIPIRGNDGFEATAFVGETSPTGELKTLKLVLCCAEHFAVPAEIHDKAEEGAAAAADSTEAAQGTTPTRKKLLPELKRNGRVSRSGLGARRSESAQNPRASPAAQSLRATFSGAKTGGRQRPMSSQGRPGSGWDSESGAGMGMGGNLKVRPQSATQRMTRDDTSPMPVPRTGPGSPVLPGSGPGSAGERARDVPAAAARESGSSP